MKDKFVVTGTGRCGTQYIASVLTICGIKCGHQKVDYKARKINFNNLDGDSSFRAVKHIDKLKRSAVKIIGIYRHPVKVIRSILELKQVDDFIGCEIWTFSIKTLCNYYIRVNTELKKRADILFEIDHIDLKELFSFIGFADKYSDNLVSAIPKDANSRNEQKKRTLELEESDIDPRCIHLYKKMRIQRHE